MKTRTNIELKKIYWYGKPGMNDDEVNHLVALYGDNPATTGEAVFVLRYRIKELISSTFNLVKRRV